MSCVLHALSERVTSYYCAFDSTERLFSDVEATTLTIVSTLPSRTHFHHRNRSFLSLSTGLTCHRTTLHNTALLVRCQSREPLVPNQRIALLLCRTLRILDAGIHVACAVWRKFYDGTGAVDWLLLPDCLSGSLFFWESFAFQVVASCFEPCIIRVDPVTSNAILGWI